MRILISSQACLHFPRHKHLSLAFLAFVVTGAAAPVTQSATQASDNGNVDVKSFDRIVVDGVKYPRTAAGVNAAVADCISGTPCVIEVPHPGDYSDAVIALGKSHVLALGVGAFIVSGITGPDSSTDASGTWAIYGQGVNLTTVRLANFKNADVITSRNFSTFTRSTSFWGVFRAMVTNRAIDWGRFIDVDTRTYDGPGADNKKRLQFAYRIDTSVVNPLSQLPPAVAANPSSLAQRNLLRGWRLGLPSGQHVAHAMGVTPMDDKDILIGKGVDTQDPADVQPFPITDVSTVFTKNCPFWTYILAEAVQHKETVKIPVKESISITTPRLGPVGGRIVAEVFLGLIFGDNHSLLNLEPSWQPPNNPNFSLKDFVNYALGK